MRSVADALQDPSLFVSSVMVLLIDNFGTEVIHWEPESVETELYDVFKVNVTPALSDKINAGSALLASDLYHKSLEGFTAVNRALNLKPVSSEVFNDLTIDDLMWGCTEARMLEGPETFDASGFSHPIAGYAAQLLSAEGITKPPKILSFAEYPPEELDQRGIALAADPAAAQAYWARQADQNAELERRAAELLKELTEEIASLPLKHGKAKLPDLAA